MRVPDDAKVYVSNRALWKNIALSALHRLLFVVFFVLAAADSGEKHHVMAPLNHSKHAVLVSEDIIKPKCDKLGYRSIVLPNKLRVLLISDPETDKAAAALNVRCWPWLSRCNGTLS